MTIGEQEARVRKWLASDSESSRENLRAWITETPAPYPADLLARIAMEAENDATTIGQTFSRLALLSIIVLALFGMFYHNIDNLLAHLPLIVLLVPFLFTGTSQGATGLRAALYLAELGDPRAIGHLARCWRPRRWARARNMELIESLLLTLLTRATSNPQTREFDVLEVRAFAMRAWRSRRRGRDLTDDRADLLIAALRYLRVSESPHALPFLERFTTLSVVSAHTPNRVLVRTAAHVLLNRKEETPDVRFFLCYRALPEYNRVTAPEEAGVSLRRG